MSKVTVKDRGYDALMKRMAKQAKSTLTVGIHEAEGSEDHEGATVAEVMGFHEFGLGVPQRSWLGAWFDENESENQERMRKIGEAVLKGTIASSAQALERLGLFAVGSIQQRMANGIAPALAPATIKAKGGSVPLIDSGLGRSSITHKIDK